jgi:hypothetical protein
MTKDQKAILNAVSRELEEAMRETKPDFALHGPGNEMLVMTEDQRHNYVRRCFKVAVERLP